MSNLIADERWYRIRPIKPYLLGGVDISPHEYRGEGWFVLRDPVNGELHRLDRASFEVVRRLDGLTDVAAIHQALLDARGDKAPTQHDLLQLLAELAQSGLIQTDRAGDIEQLKWRDRKRRRANLTDRINPLSFKVAMFNLETVIDRLEPLAMLLFSRTATVIAAGLVMTALVLGVISSGDLFATIARAQANPSFLFLVWIAYPLMKICHELAHAMAARRFNARVTDIGVRLLVLMPVPYVDASLSALLPDKRQRAIVAAAGIAAELVIASIALLLWLQMEAGLISDFMLALILIGFVSTLFFNGNPLLRFDGYYVFTDLLELPNLARRSNQYLLNVVMIYALRIHRVSKMHTAPGEKPWLLGYAIASWTYRVIVFASIAAFVAQFYRPAGILVAAAAVMVLVIMPLARGALFLQSSPSLIGRRALTTALIGGYLVALFIVLIVPAPKSTMARGVVWLPERAILRAESSGTIATVYAKNGQMVSAGDLIAQLRNDDLALEVERLKARFRTLEVDRLGKLAAQSGQADAVLPELERTRGELATARKALNGLALTARTDGRLVLPSAADRAYSWLGQGDTLGYVLGDSDTTVRVALTNEDALTVRANTGTVAVRLAESPGLTWAAQIVSEAPAAQRELPSAALGQAGGGRIAVDPADPEGRRTKAPVFVLDVQITGRTVARAGATAHVRFDHSNQALLLQAGSALRSLFLRRFDS